MIRVVVVDDHELSREGLRSILENELTLDVIGVLDDGAGAADFVSSEQIDVVLMDISMPGVDGITATREVRLRSPETAVIMLTALPDDDHVREALRAGASGYLLKTCSATELVSAVRGAFLGLRSFDAGVLDRVIDSFTSGPAVRGTTKDGSSATVPIVGAAAGEAAMGGTGAGRPGRDVAPGAGGAEGTAPAASFGVSLDSAEPPVPEIFSPLTERELEVFMEVGRGRSNAEISETLFLSEKTVKTYVTRILGKLGLASRVQAVVLAFESGLITRDAG